MQNKISFIPDYLDASVIEQKIKVAKERRIAPEIKSAISDYHSQLELSEKQTENLAAIKSDQAVMVITGHQTSALLGPLYLFYKTLTAIKLASHLSSTYNIKAVPVFWLQTEDHDLAEVLNFFSLSKTGEISEFNLNQEVENRISLEYIDKPAEALNLCDVVSQQLEGLAHEELATKLIRDAANPTETLVNSFRSSMQRLFSEDGLLFFNPKIIPANFLKPIFKRAFVDYKEIGEKFSAQESLLKSKGLEPQVFTRADSPLFFFHPEAKDGPRYRISKTGDTWQTIGTELTFSEDEINSILENDPARFSTSALLRPIVQDSLLPTVAYIGGPSEVNYFKQLPPLYEIFGLTMPLIVPRASFLLIEPKVKRLLEELGIESTALRLTKEELTTKLTSITEKNAKDSLRTLVDTHLQAIDAALNQALPAVDKTLGSSIEKTSAKAKASYQGLLERYEDALLRSDKLRGERLERLQSYLNPNQTHQERIHPAIYYLARYGLSFKSLLLAQLELFNSDTKEIIL